jgi:hypothetical protein
MGKRQQPVACDLTVLTGEERTRQSALAQSLRAAVRDVHETAEGYELTLDPHSDIVKKLRDFLTIEKRCCPFLEFAVSSSEDGTVVGITGPDGVKEFLKAEYGLG